MFFLSVVRPALFVGWFIGCFGGGGVFLAAAGFGGVSGVAGIDSGVTGGVGGSGDVGVFGGCR
jgi:hypothetical protein